MKNERDIADLLVQENILAEGQKELVEFGLYHGKLLLVNCCTILIIGGIFGQIPVSVLFLVFFSILRSYAGGYHAGTVLRCFFISMFLISSGLWLIRMGFWSISVCIVMSILSSIVILILSPVDNANKKLDVREKQVFRKRTLILLLIEVICLGSGIYFGITILYQAVSLAIALTGGLVLAGKIKNLVGENQKQKYQNEEV